MGIVNIDAATFEAMLSKFEHFATRVEALCRMHGERDFNEWLDNQDVCLLLKISPRTLQTLRDNGTLVFTRISGKIYYRARDVEKIIPVVKKSVRMPHAKAKQYNLKNDFMSNDVITKENNERIKLLFRLLERLSLSLERMFASHKPTLNGESFYTDEELSEKLRLSRRSLQDYRNQGRIPYIKIGGKILYRASDIEKLLEEGFHDRCQ